MSILPVWSLMLLLLGLVGVAVAQKSHLRFRDRLLASIVSLLVPVVGPLAVIACVLTTNGRSKAGRTA